MYRTRWRLYRLTPQGRVWVLDRMWRDMLVKWLRKHPEAHYAVLFYDGKRWRDETPLIRDLVAEKAAPAAFVQRSLFDKENR